MESINGKRGMKDRKCCRVQMKISLGHTVLVPEMFVGMWRMALFTSMRTAWAQNAPNQTNLFQHMENCKTNGLTRDICHAHWWLEWPVVSAAKSSNLGQFQS